MKHDNITDIATYLELCGPPHKRKYCGMSAGICIKLSSGNQLMPCGNRLQVNPGANEFRKWQESAGASRHTERCRPER